jgi:hypothetical protein
MGAENQFNVKIDNDGNQVLNVCDTLAPDASYISGDFFADIKPYFSRWLCKMVQMRITNVDTQLDYRIVFDSKHRYTYYQLAPGRYEISAIEIHYYTDGNSWGLGRTVWYDLKVNPKLLRSFEVKPGECLYLGDYAASFTGTILKTAKISLKDGYTDQKKDLQRKNIATKLAGSTLDITEVSLPVPSADLLSADQNSVVAFRLYANRGSFDLVLVDMTRSKSYRFRFSNKNPMFYAKVAPGEYCTIIDFKGSLGSNEMDYYERVPKELFWPFTVNTKEVLYLGRVNLRIVWNKINSSYRSEIATDQPEITEKYSPELYNIRALNE